MKADRNSKKDSFRPPTRTLLSFLVLVGCPGHQIQDVINIVRTEASRLWLECGPRGEGEQFRKGQCGVFKALPVERQVSSG